MNSTHVKLGNVWWPRSALEGARFVENDDGVIVAFGLLMNGNDQLFEGNEAADLRAWLAGEPVADNAATEQVEALMFAMEDAAKVWEAWVEVGKSSDDDYTFTEWLDLNYRGYDTEMLYRRIHAAYHENR